MVFFLLLLLLRFCAKVDARACRLLDRNQKARSFDRAFLNVLYEYCWSLRFQNAPLPINHGVYLLIR